MKTTYKLIVLIMITILISCSSDDSDDGDNGGNGGNNNNLFSEINVLSTTNNTSIDFGRGFPEHDEVLKHFKITNLGDADLNITSIVVPSGYSLSETFSATSLNPNESITLGIKFIPLLEQEYSGNISINSDADNGTNTLSLNGLGSKKVLDFDGNEYNIVKIGTRLWLKENFRGTHFSNGDPIPSSNFLGYTDTNLNETYGKFYTWEAGFYWDSSSDRPVSRSLIEGFFIPSNYRWNQLFDELGGTSIAGGKMKVTGTNLWDAPNTGATNTSGFSAIPSGSVSLSQNLYGIGEYAAFWSYKQTDPAVYDYVYSTRIHHDSESLDFNHNHFTGYYSIRLYR